MWYEGTQVMDGLRSCEWAGSDVAVFASQVANLASFRLGWVARWDLATNVWIKMSGGSSAVAVSGDWLVVDMVHF